MTSEEKKILVAFEKMQQAMIDKDIETLRELTSEDKTFTHMSGKKQTREEFFEEIQRDILNYHRYVIHNPLIRVNGNYAYLKTNVTLTARVYGISGSWTLFTEAYYVKQQGEWIQCNKGEHHDF